MFFLGIQPLAEPAHFTRCNSQNFGLWASGHHFWDPADGINGQSSNTYMNDSWQSRWMVTPWFDLVYLCHHFGSCHFAWQVTCRKFGHVMICHTAPSLAEPQEDDYCDRMISERDSEGFAWRIVALWMWGRNHGRNHGMSMFQFKQRWGWAWA